MQLGDRNCQLCELRDKDSGGNGTCYLLRAGSVKTYARMAALDRHDCAAFKPDRRRPPAAPEATEAMF